SSFKDYYREKQQEAASTALKQPSLANAVAVIKDTFPFEYLTFGNQMRGNIEYELQQIEKQKEIEYKPVYDSTSFKIPEEHRNKIKEWLDRGNIDSFLQPVSKSRKRRRLADGKSYGGGAGRITKALEHKLADSYGVAIRQSSEWAKNLDEGDAVKLIERRCRAAFLHNIKNPNGELQHGLCQTEPYSWYSYQKDKYVPLKQKIDPAKQIKRLDPIFLEILTPMIDTLTNPILLRRCLRGATQNANESINSVVWSILPKSKYHGYRSIRGAAAISLIFFNRGRSGLAEFFDQVGIPVTDELLCVLLGKDCKRIEKTIILNDMISSNDEKNSNDSKVR
ncbi:unnamed protein product, partial [Rotaria socialis]